MLLNLGSAALLDGELGEAKPLLAEALRIAREIDDRVAQFYLLAALGCHAAEAGQARLAARLIASADAERTGAGANVMPFLAPALARATESAAAALGPARFAAESEAGRHLGRDAALNLALGQPGRPGGGPRHAGPGTAAPGRSAQREADVARLVADGLTNKQIGARLFISERTVDSHVRSILNKLGFSSRAQIAAWMASPGTGSGRRRRPARLGSNDPDRTPERSRHRRSRCWLAACLHYAGGHDQGTTGTARRSQLRRRASGPADRAGVRRQRGRRRRVDRALPGLRQLPALSRGPARS